MLKRLSEMGDLAGCILDAMPSPIFLVDDHVRIIGLNLAASQMVDRAPEMVISKLPGDVLHCIHAEASVDGCGSSDFCGKCTVRNSIYECFRGNGVVRKKEKTSLAGKYGRIDIHLLVTAKSIKNDGKRLALLILEDVSELMKLKSMLPICANCRKIRDDEGYWSQIETYLSAHSDTQFTHSICPECAKKLYPGLYDDDEPDSQD